MPRPVFRFGPYTLDMGAYQLSRDATILPLPPKVLDLLALLAARPGQLFTKDDILTALWPGVAVTDNAITQVVSAAREALGDDATAPAFIQTVPRKGYRFIAEVSGSVQAEDPAPRPPDTASTTAARRRLAVSDFVNLSGTDAPAWLGAGIAETLTNDLRGVADFVLIDRTAVPSAVRQGDVPAAAGAGIALLVVGSYQVAGAHVRITGRVIDVGTADVIAQAKADGPLSDVFALQDAIVRALLAKLHLRAPAVTQGARETPSLAAYEALTEGRLKLDSLDPDLAQAALDDFTRAVTLDPGYALAWVGLAHAHFWLHQRTRLGISGDTSHFEAAVSHAERAIAIDPHLGEAHAAIAFFLAHTGRGEDAVRAGRRAVELEPHDWRHHFRLAVAAWGDERLATLGDVHRLYPDFTPASLVGAMVHVARGDLAAADGALRRGITALEAASDVRSLRFPANGLGWLRGLIALAEGRPDDAQDAFDQEQAWSRRGLYADEYARNVAEGRGFAALAEGDPTSAARWFRQAADAAPGYPRALTGLADALRRNGGRDGADAALAEARVAIDALSDAGRTTEAGMALAHWQVVAGRPEDAIATLDRLLHDAPPGMAGWTLPVEPWMAPLRSQPICAPLFLRLAERAR